MKIVIEIPRKTYEHIRADGGHGYFNIWDEDNRIVTKAVFNGKKLPEHHGDLIDRSKICKAIPAEEDNCTGFGMTYDEMDIYNDGINSMWNKLQNADPIIKADTRRDEG